MHHQKAREAYKVVNLEKDYEYTAKLCAGTMFYSDQMCSYTKSIKLDSNAIIVDKGGKDQIQCYINSAETYGNTMVVDCREENDRMRSRQSSLRNQNYYYFLVLKESGPHADRCCNVMTFDVKVQSFNKNMVQDYQLCNNMANVSSYFWDFIPQ